MATKLTQWFSESVKPVNIGVYQVRVRGNRQLTSYAFWDGSNWGFPHSYLSDFVSPKSGADYAVSRRQGSAVAPQANEWRGILLSIKSAHGRDLKITAARRGGRVAALRREPDRQEGV